MHFTVPINQDTLIKSTISVNLTKQLLAGLNIDDALVIYKNEIMDEENVNSNLSRTRGIKNRETYVNSSYTSEIMEDNNAGFRLRNNLHTPVLSENNNFKVTPVYTTNKFELRLDIKSKSMNTITDIINKVRLIGMDGTDTLHNLDYRYYLPDRVVKLINNIYDIRKRVVGDVDNMIDFLNTVMHKKWSIVSDVSGRNMSINILDTINSCVGRYTSNGYDLKAVYDKDTLYYSVEITYNIFYNDPIYLTAMYEISQYNEMLDSDLIIHKYKESYYRASKTKELLSKVMMKYTKPSIYEYIHDKMVHIPAEDVYKEYNGYVGIPLFSALVLVDDSGILFNLNNLGDIEIEPYLLQFMRDGEHKYICNDFGSMLQLTTYEDNVKINNVLTVDSDLNVRSIEPFNISKRYRIIMSININIEELDNAVQNRIKAFIDSVNINHHIGNVFIPSDEEINYFKPIIANSGVTAAKYNLIYTDMDMKTFIYKQYGELHLYHKWICDSQTLPPYINKVMLTKAISRLNIKMENVISVYSNGKNMIIKTLESMYYIKYINGDIQSILKTTGVDFELILNNGVIIVFENAIYKKYINGVLISESNSLNNVMHTVFETVIGINSKVLNLDDGPTMRTVMLSSVITNSIRGINGIRDS